MAELFLIRHPQAHRRLFDEHGEMYGLTPEGIEQAREVGKHLLEIVGAVPDIFERATSIRSEQAATVIAGTAGISTLISAQEAFNRTGYTPDKIQARMHEWMFKQRESGIYVAVMSRAAIVGCIADQLRWTDAEVMGTALTSRADIPTGSVTHITVDPESPEPFIHYYGLMPENVVTLPEHVKY